MNGQFGNHVSSAWFMDNIPLLKLCEAIPFKLNTKYFLKEIQLCFRVFIIGRDRYLKSIVCKQYEIWLLFVLLSAMLTLSYYIAKMKMRFSRLDIQCVAQKCALLLSSFENFILFELFIKRGFVYNSASNFTLMEKDAKVISLSDLRWCSIFIQRTTSPAVQRKLIHSERLIPNF